MALTFIDEPMVHRWLSTEGLELRVDHSSQALAQANIMALGDMEFYLANRYDLNSSAILNSNWLRTVCLILTLYHLFSQRNDQPAGNIVSLRDQYLELLEKIRAGSANVPGIAANINGATNIPALINRSIVPDAYPSTYIDRMRSMIPNTTPNPAYRPNEFPRPPRV